MSYGLQIDNDVIASITRHAERAWPEECCGILVGRDEMTVTQVVASQESPNASRDDRTCRYELDPRLLVHALLECRRSEDRVVGFYHSHPDGGAMPSDYDRANGWAGKVYVIVGVTKGRVDSVRAWVCGCRGGPWRELNMAPSIQTV